MRHQPEPLRLRAQLGFGRPGAGHEEAHPAQAADQPRQRVERQVEPLLVDQPADQQHEPLVGRGEAGAQPRQVGHGLQVAGVDPVRDHGHALDAEDVAHLRPHVGRADDDAVRRAGHLPLRGVDGRLRVLPDTALVAAVLGRVDRHQPRQLRGQAASGPGDEPVVRVHEVERARQAGASHVGVHPLDPGDERVEVGPGEVRLGHPVHDDAVAVLDAGAAPARHHVHLVAEADQLLGQLAHVPRQAALDHRRVLPRERQDAHVQAGNWRNTHSGVSGSRR